MRRQITWYPVDGLTCRYVGDPAATVKMRQVNSPSDDLLNERRNGPTASIDTGADHSNSTRDSSGVGIVVLV